MKQTFKLKNGEILFQDDKIIIIDDAKKQRYMQLFSSSIWTVYGIISVFRYLKTNDQFLLWLAIIGILHFVILIPNLLRSNQSEILFDNIKSLKFNLRFGRGFLDIKLKNNRLRRVIGIENSQEIEEYVKLNIVSVSTK